MIGQQKIELEYVKKSCDEDLYRKEIAYPRRTTQNSALLGSASCLK